MTKTGKMFFTFIFICIITILIVVTGIKIWDTNKRVISIEEKLNTVGGKISSLILSKDNETVIIMIKEEDNKTKFIQK